MVLVNLIIIFLPWFIRRRILVRFYGYDIHPTATIGLSYIYPKQLEMGPHSRIHNLVVCRSIDSLKMGSDSGIANSTFITGFSVENTEYFSGELRRCELVLGKSAGITSRHFIDCNGGVYVGDYSTIAGLRSQILSHSIDLYENRQSTKPVKIGKYCFVGSGCIFLPGSAVPDFCIVGAGSVVNKTFENQLKVIAGNPAKESKNIDKASVGYFFRKQHVVH